MTARASSSGLLWPTILAIVGFSVLAGLGYWQWERMHWKTGVLARLTAAESDAPIELPMWFEKLRRDAAAEAGRRGEDCSGSICVTYDQVSEEFDVLSVRSRTADGGVAFVYAPEAGKQTYRAFAYVETVAGRLQVDRGLIEESDMDAFRKAAIGRPGSVEILALIRHGPGPQFYTPDPDQKRGIWYSVPPREFDERLGPGTLWLQEVRRDSEPAPASGPVPPTIAEMRKRIPNRHFEYALTWWGLAAGLAFVYLAFAATRLRARG